ncbi:MAG: Hsp20/alpha crystallin family protein [Bacteroidetes bacterium]|nr:Hsp20/alpha crystallin family protein [Bacteroidota bacterium]
MSLVKRNYYNVPTLNRFFDDFFTKDLYWNGENASPKLNSQPAVNVKETNQSFDLELAAPGLGKGDFNIEVNNDVLSISFEKKTENEVKEESYNVREFGYQSFKRSFTLPETVNADKIQAKYEQGVLSLTIPKKPENQPQPIKTIKIS